MKIATLVFLVKDDTIRLAKKKMKVGVDKYNGYGGKVEGGNSIEKTAIDEVVQECSTLVKESDLEKVGVCLFFIESEPAWEVHVFIARTWVNEPKESKEMGKPETFKFNQIPYDEMLSGDEKWMPLVLSGKKIKANIYYDSQMKLQDFSYIESTF
jgi:8-oxo-dGTP diphosphatase